MKAPKERSILLTGRVYVDKLLSHEYPDFRLPPEGNKAGDLKLLAVSSEPGSKRRRWGMSTNPFQGFFAAYVFDGVKWRKFALRHEAAIEATYSSSEQRHNRLKACKRTLQSLAGQKALRCTGAYKVLERCPLPAAASVQERPAGELQLKLL